MSLPSRTTDMSLTETIAPASAPATARSSAASGAVPSGIAGLVAAALSLGAGHIAGGVSRSMASPVVAVGERTITLVPVSVERFAIETFGGNDKLALVIGITAASLVIGAVIGVIGRRRPAISVVGFGAFAVVGIAASLNGRRSLLEAVVPSLLAAAIGIGYLAWVRPLVPSKSAAKPAQVGPEIPQERTKSVGNTRRTFLIAISAGAAGALVFRTAGTALRQRFNVGASRASITLPPAAKSVAQLPASVSARVPGISPFITPVADFYRVDTALSVPQVAADSWKLNIKGMVDKPFSISFDDIVNRKLVEADITLTCVSNTVGGKLLGTARWLGVPLRELLDEAGVRPGVDQIVGRSVDGYTCGFPLAAAYDRNALVAIGMNGEPLPIDHGFPARLITPGLYGYVSATKWLTEIELTTFAAFDQYWVPKGWDALAPIKTMTRIDTPRSLSNIAAGTTVIGGVAWAQTRGITGVEVRIDDGAWQQATLADEANIDTWRQWSLPWDATAGRHTITARATDGSGELQTETRAEVFPNGASGWHSFLVIVK
jgi:DMSO/TMAO reductase YedYZ molybdopterin-dependent catalytic subunit